MPATIRLMIDSPRRRAAFRRLHCQAQMLFRHTSDWDCVPPRSLAPTLLNKRSDA